MMYLGQPSIYVDTFQLKHNIEINVILRLLNAIRYTFVIIVMYQFSFILGKSSICFLDSQFFTSIDT